MMMNSGDLIYRVSMVLPGKEVFYWTFNSDIEAMTFADFMMNNYEKSTNNPEEMKYMHVSIMIERKKNNE